VSVTTRVVFKIKVGFARGINDGLSRCKRDALPTELTAPPKNFTKVEPLLTLTSQLSTISISNKT